MKKTFLLFASIVLFFFRSHANDVDSAKAALVAKNFYLLNVPTANAGNLTLTLAYQSTIESFNPVAIATGAHLYYVFNVNTQDGFVIVSGDDMVLPVLGYSSKGRYDINNVPPSLQKWLEGYKGQVIMAKENNLTATYKITKKWSSLIAGIAEPTTRSGSVAPLLTTTWDQGNVAGLYNALCSVDPSLPDQDNTTTQCPTGCVATAMAQIMKYWNYPTTGTGFNSYYLSAYGTLSANFASTTYNWSSMPNSATSGNYMGIATLMYDCGVSVDMNYGPDGSGADVIASDNPVCAQTAYVQYFGYNANTIQGLTRANYSDADWISLLENELTNGRPLQYDGFGNGDGHTFVFDGFDANNYFHVNWGWSGVADGYYTIDALNPTTIGAGGGLGSYNSGQQAVIGIEPDSLNGKGTGTVVDTADIEIYYPISIEYNPIPFNYPDTIYTDILNVGNSNFSGEVCAALFDNQGNFITFFDSVSISSPLASGNNYGGIYFVNAGMLTVPGTYVLGIYYKPTGGNWYLAGDDYYDNPINVTIGSPSGNTNGSPNNLELYSNMLGTPATFIQGQPATISVNFENVNYYTYYGQITVNLFDLFGNFVDSIATYTESHGLPPGDSYSSPIIFNTSSITVPPGTYILAAGEEEQGTSSFYYVGGDYFPNPINVNVVAPVLPPDRYEPDNTVATAYTLPLNWTGNSANPNTVGSNINTDTDIDYYRIALDAGYDYVINANADDGYKSNNGITYTCDVLWSYNDDSGWSSSYENTMPGDILVNGAGTVLFLVAPYFDGETGTYLLNIDITRKAINGITNVESLPVKIFPNPANGSFMVETNATGEQLLQVFDMTGKLMLTQTIDNSKTIIDAGNLAEGIYSVRLVSNDGVTNTKLVIVR